MEKRTNDKITSLFLELKKLQSVLVAFSGGVDSSLLLKAACMALPVEKVTAATISSILNPPGEVELARGIAMDLGVAHDIIEYHPLDIQEVKRNSRNRCYHCKTGLAGLLKKHAAAKGFEFILEGSHADDSEAYRPGAQALSDNGILSPLKNAGLTKIEIREAARSLNLPNWERPGTSCLATRFPYNVELDAAALERVGAAEEYLHTIGFKNLRARCHGTLLRLEIDEIDFGKVIDPGNRKKLIERLQKVGFNYITLDLSGFRSGGYDEHWQSNANRDSERE